MNGKKYFLSCLSASALVFSAPSWSEQADSKIFDDDEEESSFSIRPVIEYDASNEGNFSSASGNKGTFSLENGMSFGADIVFNGLGDRLGDVLGDSNLSVAGQYRYRESELETIEYSEAYNNGSMLDSAGLMRINDSVAHSGNVTTHTFGVSAEYEFDVIKDNGIMPYVHGGVNYTMASLDNVVVEAGGQTSEYNSEAGAFGFSMGVGLKAEFNDSISLNGGYTYRYHGDYDFDDLSVEDYASHSVMVGIVIRF